MRIIIATPGWYHLWFLYMLIGLYLLTPLLRCFIKNCKREHLEYFLLLFFIVGTCVPLINGLLDQLFHKGKTIYFSVPELAGFTGYYIAGYYFANYKIKNKIKTCIYILAVLSALFTIIGTSILSIYENKPVGLLSSNFTPNTMFVAYAIFILFQENFNKKVFSREIEGIILKISKYTFGIYLIHVLIFETFFIIGLNTVIISPIISIPIISIVIMILSGIGAIIISKIPIIKKCVM